MNIVYQGTTYSAPHDLDEVAVAAFHTASELGILGVVIEELVKAGLLEEVAA